MTKTEGYSGRVTAVNGRIVSFDCGAKHVMSSAWNVMVGDWIMVDTHGRLWVKK